MPHPSPFRYFRTSPEIIRLAVMPHIGFPLECAGRADGEEFAFV
jgi:hypothetical protein